ncbi:PTS mannitol transporter subunit IICBA [Clostridium polyendosporum]|uniref:Mannitol-specific phosphotransferase enzyme IIA component n=1 Tax=Clostridium polyendosporum TaxID=69208 RepID=A0A919RY89_9CLOT|nr:PTS mannitol transporter subunit IICBA [Clostridium polyendosporum]GIM28566.1 PTS mannitol transporter subunit IICBA [Clostridium polyendosporum]
MEQSVRLNVDAKSGLKDRVQKFGKSLSGMVMPNIGAFITWGFITALFIPTGWMPNESFSKLVGPMITYLLPLLIGYTGGKAVGGNRGGVLGAIATMGVIVGASIPMFIGAMIMGPLGGYVINKFDKAIEGKVKSGFEMLVNNFSAGIIGAVLALLGYSTIGPVVISFSNLLKAGVETIVNAGLLPLASIFVEPAKILFLNNAINHGVLGPIGIEQAKTVGKSIFFLLEANPGPGLGVLLAYSIFSKGMAKESAPGAMIIHFLGGIHEIYFPYVLMNPILILAVIGGGASGVLTFSIFNAGLVATASPGSIIALLALTPKGSTLGVLAGVAVATFVSFIIASIFIKSSNNSSNENDLNKAREAMQDLKGTTKGTTNGVMKTVVNKIVFSCDAGMGSSAMGASNLRNKIKKAGLNIQVVNSSVDDIPQDADIVISHTRLTARAISNAPKAEHISIENFLSDPKFDQLLNRLKTGKNKLENKVKDDVAVDSSVEVNKDNHILMVSNIKTNLKSVDKFEAIRMAGELLVKSGYVDEEYIEAMVEREGLVSTYIGGGVAIPHGVSKAKENIKKSGIVILQFPEGIQFGNEKAYLVIGIAGVGNEHLEILANIATVLEDEKIIKELSRTSESKKIYQTFVKKVV